MPHVVLTQPLVDGPLAPAITYDLSLPNFALRVGANRRVFYVRVREAGTRVRVTIGLAGDPATQPGRLRVKAARQRAAELLALAWRRRRAQAADDAGVDVLHADTVTVGSSCTRSIDEHAAGWSPAHREQPAVAWRAPASGTRPGPGARRSADTSSRRCSASTPSGAGQRQSAITRFCRSSAGGPSMRNCSTANPIDQLGKVTVEESRDRELTAAELVALWAALDAVDANPKATPRDSRVSRPVAVRLLTAQREAPLGSSSGRGSISPTSCSTFPAVVMKGRKGKRTAHVVPLGPRALALLTPARRDVASQLDLFVFGTRAGTSKAPGATRRAPIALAGFPGQRPPTYGGDAHGDAWHYRVSSIARVLAHKNASITGIYNRYEYAAEKRIALDTLDRVVGAILTPADAASAPVLPFQRAK